MTGGPEDTATVADWTRGGAGLRYTRCRGCGGVEYFARPFCPRCGGEDLDVRAASGRGTVYALTRVRAGALPRMERHAPYGIALVDAPGASASWPMPRRGSRSATRHRGLSPIRNGSRPLVASGDRLEGPDIMTDRVDGSAAPGDPGSLDAALDPRSVAVIGASDNPDKIGGGAPPLPLPLRLPRDGPPGESPRGHHPGPCAPCPASRTSTKPRRGDHRRAGRGRRGGPRCLRRDRRQGRRHDGLGLRRDGRGGRQGGRAGDGGPRRARACG